MQFTNSNHIIVKYDPAAWFTMTRGRAFRVSLNGWLDSVSL
jgi:hypothetical protein